MDKTLPELPQEVEKPENKSKNGRGCRPHFTCRQIILIIFFTLVLLFIGLIVLFTQRPPILWEPTKSLLSGNIDTNWLRNMRNEPKSSDAAVVMNKLQTQATKGNTIEISESDLNLLIREYWEREAIVDLQKDKGTVYLNLGTKNESNPLWAVGDLTAIDGKVVITRSGTGRIDSPAFMNDLSSGLINSIIGTNPNQSDLVNTLIGVNKNFRIEKIDFEENKLKLHFQSDFKFQQLLPFLPSN